MDFKEVPDELINNSEQPSHNKTLFSMKPSDEISLKVFNEEVILNQILKMISEDPEDQWDLDLFRLYGALLHKELFPTPHEGKKDIHYLPMEFSSTTFIWTFTESKILLSFSNKK